MPISGIRTLSPREVQLRAQAMACLRDQNSKCQGQVYINLFFDGTGNNWDWEGTFIKGKNVARKRSALGMLCTNPIVMCLSYP